MSLIRTQVAVNERTDAVDHNRLSGYLFENLATLLRSWQAPSNGILRRGTLAPDSGLILAAGGPIVGVLAAGTAIITATSTAVVITTPDGSNPRWDLVSLAYTETDTDSEQRFFVNPATRVKSQQATPTTSTATGTLVVTVGAAQASPAVPTTPAGNLPLWKVYVGAGVSTITAADIIPVTSSSVDPIRFISPALEAGTQSLPYVSPYTMPLAVPAGKFGLLFAFVRCQLSATGSGVHTVNPLVVSIEDVATPGTPISFGYLAPAYLNAVRYSPSMTLLVPLLGPVAEKTYQLRLNPVAPVLTGYTAYTGVTIQTADAANSFFGGILL